MTRTTVLAEKSASLQRSLTAWAKKEGLLKAGEQIQFSMQIVGVPLVMQKSETQESIRKMPVREFFTRERLDQYGKSNSARKAHNSIDMVLLADRRISTMEDFLRFFPTRYDYFKYLDRIGRVSAIGPTALRVIMKAIQATGIHFPNS